MSMLIAAFPHALLDNEQTQRQLRTTCARLLPIAIIVCLAWTAIFLLLALPWLALLLAAAAIVLGGCWMISERVSLSTGIVLAAMLCLAITTIFCLLFDLPTRSVPRTSHCYFLVVALVGYFDYRRAPRPAAAAVICAAVAGFIAFSSMNLHFAFARPVSAADHVVIAWLNPIITILLLATSMVLVQRRVATNQRMARELAGAIARDELELLFQPQVDRSSKVIGAEAMLHWNRADGPLTAEAFMPVAAESDMACHIEAWALSEAVLTLSRWQMRSHTYDLVLSLEVPAERLRSPAFVDELSEHFRAHGVHGRHLRIALKAHDATATHPELLDRLRQLRTLGVSVSLAGVGSGKICLGDLERFPLQQIELDGSFTRAASQSARSATLAHNVVDLAQALNLQVLAQGVECEAQFVLMRDCGCEAFQGPLFGPPMLPQAFDAHVLASASELTWVDEPTHG